MDQYWIERYVPPHVDLWQGRADSLAGERFFQYVHCLDLRHEESWPAATHRFAIIGFCCDEGVRRNHGRVGAAEGPRALRKALGKLAVQDFSDVALLDVGDIVCTDGDLESAQQALGEVVARLLKDQIKPIVIGGGHEVAFGHYQGIALAKPDIDLGIINFDAHFDLRPLTIEGEGHSGSPFLQIALLRQAQQSPFSYFCLGIQKTGNTRSLFETAASLDTSWIYAEDLHYHPVANYFSQLNDFIQQREAIYLTLCMDVFAAAYAPGVSAPQVMGLLPWQVLPLLRHIVRSGKVMSFNVAELAPPLDHDLLTTHLAAAMVAEYLQVR